MTAGQAVTILMRGLGYKDEDMGGIWPQSYMAEAQTNGLLKSTGITSAYAGLTRAHRRQAVPEPLLRPSTARAPRRCSATKWARMRSISPAVDGGQGTMTAGGKTYTMAHPVASTSLIGSKGKVVLNGDGDILTFLPITGTSGISNAAVIIGANGSVAGLDSLAGSTSYNIYKNGSSATAADLKRYDVATYASATNSIIVSDTRVSVYYEDCKPLQQPRHHYGAGRQGTECSAYGSGFPVQAEAWQADRPSADGGRSGGRCRGCQQHRCPGQCHGGGVRKGDVQLVCGGALLNIGTASEYAGQVVSVYADKSGLKLNKISGGVGGDLLPKEGTLGGRKLADNVMLFDGGRQIALSELSQTGVNSGRVSYARTNWAGQVDLIVLNNGLAGDMILAVRLWNSKYDPTTGNDDWTARSRSFPAP